jgi:Threonine/Serine exporter, ThrE
MYAPVGPFADSVASGTMACVFANGYGMPAATFAFPAVLVMVPGSYAFRAVIGLLAIVKAAGKSPVDLQAETLSLVVTTVLLTMAIAVGLAIPLGIPTNSRPRQNPFPARSQRSYGMGEGTQYFQDLRPGSALHETIFSNNCLTISNNRFNR